MVWRVGCVGQRFQRRRGALRWNRRWRASSESDEGQIRKPHAKVRSEPLDQIDTKRGLIVFGAEKSGRTFEVVVWPETDVVGGTGVVGFGEGLFHPELGPDPGQRCEVVGNTQRQAAVRGLITGPPALRIVHIVGSERYEVV